MLYRAKEKDAAVLQLGEDIEPVITGLGFAVVEFIVSRSRGSCQVRIVVSKSAGSGRSSIGTDELARLHKALLPRLELALEGDFSLELSSPGTDRTIKEGAEFAHFVGRRVRCYVPEKSDWVSGLLSASDQEKITLENTEFGNSGGMIELEYERIAKAKLDG